MGKKGILYCACKEASEKNCNRCLKKIRLDPDYIVNIATWPKKVSV